MTSDGLNILGKKMHGDTDRRETEKPGIGHAKWSRNSCDKEESTSKSSGQEKKVLISK
jgi:hypothetical protein